MRCILAILSLACLACWLSVAPAIADEPVDPASIITDFSNDDGMFAHGTWKGHTTYTHGVLTIDGEGVSDRGGTGREDQLDLSSYESGYFELVGAAIEGNACTNLIVQVVDADGTKANWVIATEGLGEPGAFQAARAGLPLSQPNSTPEAGDDERLDWNNIRMWQVLGYYQGKALAIQIDALRISTSAD